MELSERKKKVLRTIVDLYIRTAEPVSSKSITTMPDLDYSSATIRNEMADLTAMGLLEQPHTSAGRIPTPAGYRLYVDELMQDYRLSLDETRNLNASLELKMQEFDKMLSQVGKMVSQATELPAYVVASRQTASTVKRFELIQAGAGSIILVIMLSGDVVKNKLIKLPLELDPQSLTVLSAVLNASLTDLTWDQITPALLEKVMRSAGNAASLVPIVVEFTIDELRRQNDAGVAVAGQLRLLDQPEYHDIDKAQELFGALDEGTISNLPAIMGSGSGTQILVGPEHVAKELKDTSVVMTKFDIGDGMQGMIGVVGPTRMDYAKVTARLSYFAENLAKLFAKPDTALPPAEQLKNDEQQEV